MDFNLSETQRTLGDLAAKILADLCTHERLKTLEADAHVVFDRDLWGSLADAGILGSVVPEAHGGSGLGLVDLAQVLEEAGKAVAPVPLVPTLVLGALAVVEFGTSDQQAALLPGVAEGSVILTAALEEAGADDLASPSTRCGRDGDVWRVSGTKTMVPYARHAARVVVPAMSQDGPVVLLVDPSADGVAVTEQVPTNRQPYADLTFDHAPAELLTDRADAVTWIAERGAAALCALQAGICERAVRMTAQHTSDRKQFDKPIAEFQAVAQRAADAFIDTEMIRLTAWQALFRLDAGWPATKEVHTAKFWAGDGARRVVHAAQHLHGGLGVDLDYPLHRYFTWAKQTEHTLGTSTRELVRLGNVLAEEPV